MNIEKMSTPLVLLQYNSIDEALRFEDSQLPNQPKEYGVREGADFQEMALALENVLDKRGATYTKIVW